MANLLCSSFLREKFSFPWSILSFFWSGLPKPHCVRFWQPSRSQKRKNWSRKRKSFSQKRNCACELCHFSATLFQLLRRYILSMCSSPFPKEVTEPWNVAKKSVLYSKINTSGASLPGKWKSIFKWLNNTLYATVATRRPRDLSSLSSTPR